MNYFCLTGEPSHMVPVTEVEALIAEAYRSGWHAGFEMGRKYRVEEVERLTAELAWARTALHAAQQGQHREDN
jgi:hypothetical protein